MWWWLVPMALTASATHGAIAWAYLHAPSVVGTGDNQAVVVKGERRPPTMLSLAVNRVRLLYRQWPSKAARTTSAFMVINFLNAVVSGTLATVALALGMWPARWSTGLGGENNAVDVVAPSPPHATPWVMASIVVVLAYLAVELPLLTYARCKWDVQDPGLETVLFHCVIVVALSSVLVTGQGQLVAVFGVWGEWAAAALGVEEYLEFGRPAWRGKKPVWFAVVATFTTVVFVVQRLLGFAYFIVCACIQFVGGLHTSTFVTQGFLLLLGGAFNVRAARFRVSWTVAVLTEACHCAKLREHND